MASTNPANFANRPTEEVKAIASMGGKASHGGHSGNDDSNSKEDHLPGRNPDGTFTKGSEAAKEAGHLGGLHSHQNDGEKTETTTDSHPVGRNSDGTFTKGSEAAKEAGHLGGLHAAGKTDESEGADQAEGGALPGRNPDGTFTKGSEAAKEASHKGGMA
ncbi:hypothetical protein CKM354_001114900 [Cercospora kikuchii]|uniref:Uncharacterized protein n=1 Tax=Cercospora kikuchii TaxID=84275 RepID=A0A9P3FKX6_9PEZI|nr:uncharacterized protein CKM354_001114900 [Cercospora kikuchii]GIZ48074.1 hypothetical protein CKM354_001114900 [Cercospora kikuchii]